MFIDFDEFVLRVREMPHMIMATRKALKNDDWDQSYEDQYILESEYKKSIKLEKIVDVIPAHIIEKDKLDKELKEKRRKAHFFHGKIQFPQ